MLLHAHHLQKLGDQSVALGFVVFKKLRHHADVLGHGHIGKQADLLDDVTDVPPELYLVGLPDVLAVNGNDAGVRLDEAVDGF